MKYVFGPVPSRRLGRSLGIDPIPLKTCNWNCVYCQLGRTRPLQNIRRAYYPAQDILAEVHQVLENNLTEGIDWVTFVGSGEPTLHSDLGWLIRQVKALTNLPVAVITNGALLYQPEVRSDLLTADAVLPSLDAGNGRLYRKINRPWSELTFERLLEGLAAFRQVFTGKFWVEVMLVRGLNDSGDALQEIAAVLEKIRPDQIHLMLPIRPPAESWVQPSPRDRLQMAKEILSAVAPCVIPEAISEVVLSSAVHQSNLELAILNVVQRHPMRADELSDILNLWSPEEVCRTLHILEAAGKVRVIKRYGESFWSAREAFYENRSSSTPDDHQEKF